MSNVQLPAGFKPSAPPGGSGGQNQGSAEEQAAQQERAAAQEEMKRGMISAMLEPAARERCASTSPSQGHLLHTHVLTSVSRISLTRPQMAKQVEELLVRMGQQGQIRGQVSDQALKGLLEQVSAPPKPTTAAPVRAGTKSLGGGITVSVSPSSTRPRPILIELWNIGTTQLTPDPTQTGRL